MIQRIIFLITIFTSTLILISCNSSRGDTAAGNNGSGLSQGHKQELEGGSTEVDSTEEDTGIFTEEESSTDIYYEEVSSPETVVESSPETVVESSPETVVESSPETVVESSPETVVESSPETVVEASPETISDTGMGDQIEESIIVGIIDSTIDDITSSTDNDELLIAPTTGDEVSLSEEEFASEEQQVLPDISFGPISVVNGNVYLQLNAINLDPVLNSDKYFFIRIQDERNLKSKIFGPFSLSQLTTSKLLKFNLNSFKDKISGRSENLSILGTIDSTNAILESDESNNNFTYSGGENNNISVPDLEILDEIIE